MLSLETNEQILMVIRRHWYALFRHAAVITILAILPMAVYILNGEVDTLSRISDRNLSPTVNFFFSLYALGLILYAFTVWADYYLDVWIMTNRRLIDVEQHGLFSRTISELPMEKIQNVTLEIHGIMATILHFGNLRVETASRSTFVIRDAPHMYKAKELILKHMHRQTTDNQNSITNTTVNN